MTQILHISDTHLGKRPYGQDFREQDIYNVFNQLIDTAIKDHVNAIIHTGDFFDISEPSNKAEIEAVKALKRLKEHNIPFITIAGDHDTPKRADGRYPQDLLIELGLINFLHARREIEYVINDVEIYGISHVPSLYKDDLKKRLQSFKPEGKKSILMLHQGIEEELSYEGAFQISENDLPRNFVYYACGHIHTRTLKHLDGGRILEIAGSPDIMREEEIEGYLKNGKGATLIDFSKGEPEVQFINLDIRPQFVEEIDTTKLDEDVKRVSEKLRQYKERPMLHIVLKGITIPRDHLHERLKVLGEYASLVRIYKDETKSKEEEKVEVEEEGAKLDDLIMKYLTEVEGFTKAEAEVTLDVIKHGDDREYAKGQIRKMLGLEEENKSRQEEERKKKTDISSWFS